MGIQVDEQVGPTTFTRNREITTYITDIEGDATVQIRRNGRSVLTVYVGPSNELTTLYASTDTYVAVPVVNVNRGVAQRVPTNPPSQTTINTSVQTGGTSASGRSTGSSTGSGSVNTIRAAAAAAGVSTFTLEDVSPSVTPLVDD